MPTGDTGRTASAARSGGREAEPSSRGAPLGELAEVVGGVLVGRADLLVAGLQTLELADPTHLTFVGSPRHARQWPASRAGAALVSDGLLPREADPLGRSLVFVPDADQAMIALLERFAPPVPHPDPGVHPTAWVAPDAVVDATASVGPHASVESGARVGARAVLRAGVRLYPDAQVGEDTVVHANSVIRERCVVGRRCLLHQGVLIGADGFGFRPDPVAGGLRKVPQIGIVEIEDEVEIGAGTCIDRAKFGATVVGAGTKIDDQVMIGHNCRIGRCCVIAGSTGLAGSVVVGDFVQIGGGVGIADHVTIGDRARIAGMSGVRTDVPAGATVMGYPAEEAAVALRQAAAVRKLPEFLRRASRLLDASQE